MLSETELIEIMDRYEDIDIRNMMATELLALREQLANECLRADKAEAKLAFGRDISMNMDRVKSSMAKGIAEAIQNEALRIMFDEITPDTETIAMQYESLVKRINRTEDKPDD